jgi:hypothetical protein
MYEYNLNNDTLVSSIDQEDLYCDSMVNDFSEPRIYHDFVRRHLSVESQNLLARSDYDDDDSNHSSADVLTMDDPNAGL